VSEDEFQQSMATAEESGFSRLARPVFGGDRAALLGAAAVARGS